MDLVLLFVTCFVNLVLGFIVFSRDPGRAHARLFLGMSVAICLWISANYLTNHYLGSAQLVETSNRLAFALGYGVVVVGLMFTYYFPVERRAGVVEATATTALVLVTFILSLTSLVAGSAVVKGEAVSFTAGPLAILYLVSFIIVVSLIAKNLLRISEGVSLKIKQQARIVLFAFVLSALTGLTFNLILPLSGQNWGLTRLGPTSTIILVGLTAYAIIRHGLFDIKFAAIRTVGYALTLATLSVVYFLMAYLASVTIFKGEIATGFSVSPANVALALVLAFIFQPIKRFFDRTTDTIFYKDRYDSSEFIARLSEVLTTTTELRSLLRRASDELGSTLKAAHAYFFVTYAEGKHVSAGTKDHAVLTFQEYEAITRLVKDQENDVFLADFYDDSHPLRQLMDKKKMSILMVLRRRKSIVGVLVLGDQLSGRYTSRDVKVLNTINDELLIAIQNSLSVQEVRDINAHLQQRINEATSELRVSNRKLQQLDKSKDEFISMASHQLRTPLTAVKGYLSMVLEGDIGDISKEQRQVLEQAFDSSQRMVYLIGDFLNVSRIQTGKFVLELAPVDLARLIPEEIDQLVDTATRRKITMRYDGPESLPVVEADENKLRQVMMNFMDNAVYYSRADSTVLVRLYKDAGDIVFKVIDTGIGVPKSEQPHLFTKFYRATNARQQRPDGTGIGLYMAKKVIVSHGGSVIFETKEGVGSTFGFRLPLKNQLEQLEEKPQADRATANHAAR